MKRLRPLRRRHCRLLGTKLFDFVAAMSPTVRALTPAEVAALQMVARSGGELLEYRVEEVTRKDLFGCPVPGIAVFRRLVKAGYLYLTIEDPVEFEDGSTFSFTPSFCLTDAGVDALGSVG